MEVVVDQCKPDPAGKSAGSFNGETGHVAVWPTSFRFHAVRKNL
jgi:hypothetical protein